LIGLEKMMIVIIGPSIFFAAVKDVLFNSARENFIVIKIIFISEEIIEIEVLRVFLNHRIFLVIIDLIGILRLNILLRCISPGAAAFADVGVTLNCSGCSGYNLWLECIGGVL
jgi:hypothetical protein